MNIQPNPNIPYFAYGLFKHDQFAFAQIAKYVQRIDDFGIDGRLSIRDGVPIFDTARAYLVRGDRITFLKNSAEKAYRTISDFVGHQQYKWVIHSVNHEIAVNVLIDRRPDYPSDLLEEPFWSGKQDPMFSHGMNLIKKFIDKYAYPFNEKPFDWERLFKLQMVYSQLWSAIERYCNLAYGLLTTPKVGRGFLAADKIFQESLETVLNGIEKDGQRFIYNSRSLDERYYLNRNNTGYSLRYYYGVRSNLLHHGKQARQRDSEIILMCLVELYQIFKLMLRKNGIE